MDTVEQLFTTIGRDKITAATGFGAQVLSRAVTENLMPPGWYPAIRDLCRAEGVKVPDHLFRWSSKRRRPNAPAEPARAVR